VSSFELRNNQFISKRLLGRSNVPLTHLDKDFKFVSVASEALHLSAAVHVFLFLALQEEGTDEGTFKFVRITVVLRREGGQLGKLFVVSALFCNVTSDSDGIWNMLFHISDR
jgi:hypothetical protein